MIILPEEKKLRGSLSILRQVILPQQVLGYSLSIFLTRTYSRIGILSVLGGNGKGKMRYMARKLIPAMIRRW